MKNHSLIVALLYVLTFSPALSAQSTDPDILGVYQYQLENYEGMSMLTPTHFIWIMTEKNRPAFKSETPSITEKARAFEALMIGAGTWKQTAEGRIEVNCTVNIDPSQVGRTFEYEYEVEGDLVKYWFLDENGERSAINLSRKIAPWEASGGCSRFNGVWEYEGLGEKSLYIQSGNYGAWIIQNNIVTDLSDDAGKAKAFDTINVAFVMADCQKGQKDFWHILHDGDYRREKSIISGSAKLLKKGHYQVLLYDEKGNPTDATFRIKRIDNF